MDAARNQGQSTTHPSQPTLAAKTKARRGWGTRPRKNRSAARMGHPQDFVAGAITRRLAQALGRLDLSLGSESGAGLAGAHGFKGEVGGRRAGGFAPVLEQTAVAEGQVLGLRDAEPGGGLVNPRG